MLRKCFSLIARGYVRCDREKTWSALREIASLGEDISLAVLLRRYVAAS